MSEETTSITKLIYIPLLDEGVDVVRPTQAIEQGLNIFRVLPTDGYDEDVETWAFVPGSVVECVEEQRGARRLLVARRLL